MEPWLPGDEGKRIISTKTRFFVCFLSLSRSKAMRGERLGLVQGGAQRDEAPGVSDTLEEEQQQQALHFVLSPLPLVFGLIQVFFGGSAVKGTGGDWDVLGGQICFFSQ